MLVLQRRLGERVLIGEDVTLTILSIQNHHIELGIDAPSSMLIGEEEKFTKFTRLLLKKFKRKAA